MVHQVWIYRFDHRFIVAFPEVALQESTIREALIVPGSSVDLGSVVQWLSSFIGLLDMPVGLPMPLLDMYEELLSTLIYELDEYFRKPFKEQDAAAEMEKQFFIEVDEIREELSMIRSVVSQQVRVWTELESKILSGLSSEGVRASNESVVSQTPSNDKRPEVSRPNGRQSIVLLVILMAYH